MAVISVHDRLLTAVGVVMGREQNARSDPCRCWPEASAHAGGMEAYSTKSPASSRL